MRALTRRVDMVEVQLLASTLVVQRRAGGDLPEAMESLARVVRDRLNYQRQFRAATAAGRLSTILIALVGPALVFGHLAVADGLHDGAVGNGDRKANGRRCRCLVRDRTLSDLSYPSSGVLNATVNP